MKAAVYEKYGSADVLEVKEIDRPEIGDKQVLVKVFAAQVTTADWRFRASEYPVGMGWVGRAVTGFLRPRNTVLGANFAGRIVSVGAAVTRFKLGDEVFGTSGHGAHAEYLAIAEDGVITRKPANVSYEEAAATPFGALTALVFLRDYIKVRPGQKVLIVGASGGVGVFLVQMAKLFGAEVTGVTTKGDLVKSLGADRTIDYRVEDYTAAGEVYDTVIATVASTSFSEARNALKPGGMFVPIEGETREVLRSLFTRFSSKKVLFNVSLERLADLETVAAMLEKREIVPVIDAVYPLDRVTDAHRRVESRHKSGAVVLTMHGAASRSGHLQQAA